MIFFLHGPDTFRSNEKLDELKTKFINEVDKSGFNLVELDGEKITIDDFHGACSTTSLLARKRMVIVKNLIGKNKDKNIFGKIAEYLTDKKLADTILIFWEEDLGKHAANPLFKKLKLEKLCHEFKLLKPDQINRWTRNKLIKAGGRANFQVIKTLAALAGNDLYQLNQEIDKLTAYARGREITFEDLDLLVKGNFEQNIFQLTDAISNKNKKTVLDLMEQQLRSGANELYLLSMLIRQFRILILVKLTSEVKKNAGKQEIANELNLHPFVVEKSLSQIKNFSLDKLKLIYRELLQTDIYIKTGKTTARNALWLLVSEVLM